MRTTGDHFHTLGEKVNIEDLVLLIDPDESKTLDPNIEIKEKFKEAVQ